MTPGGTAKQRDITHLGHVSDEDHVLVGVLVRLVNDSLGGHDG